MKRFFAVVLLFSCVFPTVAAPPLKAPHKAKTYSSLTEAVKADDLEAVRAKIKLGVDVNGTFEPAFRDGDTPIDFATSQAMIDLLLAHGAYFGVSRMHLKTAVGPPQTITGTDMPVGMKTEDVVAFFKDFTTNHQAPTRSPFETDAEYHARLGPDFDRSKIYYFAVDADSLENSNFQYDITAKRMTVIGGSELLSDPRSDKSDAIKTIVVHHQVDDHGSYTGQTEGGAEVDVDRMTVTDYSFDFDALATWPTGLFDESDVSKTKHHFLITFPIEPKPAEALSKHIKMIIAVKLRSYNDSGSKFSHGSLPTFDDPTNFSAYSSWIAADLVSVSVWDTETNTLISQVKIRPVVLTPPQPAPQFALPSDVLKN